MPRLRHPGLTKWAGIMALVSEYRKCPEFMSELKEIKRPFKDSLQKINADAKSDMDLFSFLDQNDFSSLKPYYDAIERLAKKWKLNAPWATDAILLSEEMASSSNGEPDGKTGISLNILEQLSSSIFPMESLKIEIPALALFFYSRETILADISNTLKNFENKIKETGIKEFPSSLEKHAHWWFEHYVLDKKYKEIGKQEVVVEETIKRKVWEFTRLVGIKVA